MNINIKANGIYMRSQSKLHDVTTRSRAYFNWHQDSIVVEMRREESAISLGMSVAEAQRLHELLGKALSSAELQKHRPPARA